MTQQYQYDPSKPWWVNYSLVHFQTGELDPFYIVAKKAISVLGRSHVQRLVMAMSLYYHMESACFIADNSDEENFWDVCIANYPTLPRGSSRRYFRGDQGLACLNYLKANYKTPSDFIESSYAPTYAGLLKKFDPVPAYGAYHTWKFWDFYDRVLGMPVAMDEAAYKSLPAEPVAGFKNVAQMIGSTETDVIQIAKQCVATLQDIGALAPPDGDRLVHIAEVETVMCGISHHFKGTDWVGKDLMGYHSEMAAIEGRTAKVLTDLFPPMLPRDFFSPPPEVVSDLKKMFPKYRPAEVQNTSSILGFLT